MHALLTLAAAVVAVAAAVRSTWSPCGVSMLATVTPLAEQGRGHRYRSTAAWFIAGGTAGGATLGLAMAALALGVRAASPSTVALAAVACAAPSSPPPPTPASAGFHLPFHSRQVNERWLDQFRPWVYGAGFGWQIGAGLVTYIKTAALYLMIVLAALTAEPRHRAGHRRRCSGWCAGWPSCSGGASPARPPSPRSTGASPTPGPSSSPSSWPANWLVAVAFAAVLSPWARPRRWSCSAARRRWPDGPAGARRRRRGPRPLSRSCPRR